MLLLRQDSEKQKLTDKVKKKLIVIGTHITNSWPVKGDDTYLTRRWDLLNLIGSSWLAIVQGSIVGYLIRYFIVEPTMKFTGQAFPGTQTLIGEATIDMVSIVDLSPLVPTAALLIFLWLGYRKVLDEHLSMLNHIVWSYAKNLHAYDKDRLDDYLEYIDADSQQ